MKLSQFAYDRPLNLDRQHNTQDKGCTSSMMVVIEARHVKSKTKYFRDVMEYYDDQDVFGVNNTKYFPQEYGRKEKNGRQKIEVFLLGNSTGPTDSGMLIVDPQKNYRVGNRRIGDTENWLPKWFDNTTSRGRTNSVFVGRHE